MLFGKEFKILKELPKVFRLIGEGYPEYFYAVSDEYNSDILDYFILDDVFGQPSPANWTDTPYAKKLREKSETILQELIDDGYIEVIKYIEE